MEMVVCDLSSSFVVVVAVVADAIAVVLVF